MNSDNRGASFKESSQIPAKTSFNSEYLNRPTIPKPLDLSKINNDNLPLQSIPHSALKTNMNVSHPLQSQSTKLSNNRLSPYLRNVVITEEALNSAMNNQSFEIQTKQSSNQILGKPQQHPQNQSGSYSALTERIEHIERDFGLISERGYQSTAQSILQSQKYKKVNSKEVQRNEIVQKNIKQQSKKSIQQSRKNKQKNDSTLSSSSSSSSSLSSKSRGSNRNVNKHRQRPMNNKQIDNQEILQLGTNLIKEVNISKYLTDIFLSIVGSTEHFRRLLVEKRHFEVLIGLLKVLLKVINSNQFTQQMDQYSFRQTQKSSQTNSMYSHRIYNDSVSTLQSQNSPLGNYSSSDSRKMVGHPLTARYSNKQNGIGDYQEMNQLPIFQSSVADKQEYYLHNQNVLSKQLQNNKFQNSNDLSKSNLSYTSSNDQIFNERRFEHDVNQNQEQLMTYDNRLDHQTKLNNYLSKKQSNATVNFKIGQDHSQGNIRELDQLSKQSPYFEQTMIQGYKQKNMTSQGQSRGNDINKNKQMGNQQASQMNSNEHQIHRFYQPFSQNQNENEIEYAYNSNSTIDKNIIHQKQNKKIKNYQWQQQSQSQEQQFQQNSQNKQNHINQIDQNIKQPSKSTESIPSPQQQQNNFENDQSCNEFDDTYEREDLPKGSDQYDEHHSFQQSSKGYSQNSLTLISSSSQLKKPKMKGKSHYDSHPSNSDNKIISQTQLKEKRSKSRSIHQEKPQIGLMPCMRAKLHQNSINARNGVDQNDISDNISQNQYSQLKQEKSTPYIKQPLPVGIEFVGGKARVNYSSTNRQFNIISGQRESSTNNQ